MIRIFCDRCNLEIHEEDEGIPLKAEAFGVEPDGESSTAFSVVADDNHTGPRLVCVVIDEDGEPMENGPHYCIRCTQVMMEEYGDLKMSGGSSDDGKGDPE